MVVLGGLLFFVSRRRVHIASMVWLRPRLTDTFGSSVQDPARREHRTRGSSPSRTCRRRASPIPKRDCSISPSRSSRRATPCWIVDCEVSAALSESVGLTGELTGLSDFLAQADHKGEPLCRRGNRIATGVYIMPVGTKPSRIPALLAKGTAGDTLASLGSEYAHVVINAPAILTAGEMRDLTPQIDGIILVTPVERSAGLKHAAVRQVEEYGGKVLGLVEDSALSSRRRRAGAADRRLAAGRREECRHCGNTQLRAACRHAGGL